MIIELIHALPTSQRRGYSRKEAASYLGVSPTTFDKLVTNGIVPQAIKLLGRNVWDIRALNHALDAATGTANVVRADVHDLDEILDRELAAFGDKHGYA
jgi:predicted DNA-binding transcriptional regulator AlpA